jgi:hypothetical protein
MRMRKTAAIVCLAALAGCVSHEIPLRSDGTVAMGEHKTAGMSAMDAARIAILDAAKLTVDHGGRYFRILRSGRTSAIRPGADVLVQVMDDGDPRAGGPGVFDAPKLLIEGVPQTVLNGFAAVPPPRTQAPQGPAGTPRCTAYGCVW